MEARKIKIAMEDCIKCDIKRVGEEWNKMKNARGRKRQWKRTSWFYGWNSEFSETSAV